MNNKNTGRIKATILIGITFFVFVAPKLFPQVSIMDKAFGGKKGIFVYFDKDIPLKENTGEQKYGKSWVQFMGPQISLNFKTVLIHFTLSCLT